MNTINFRSFLLIMSLGLTVACTSNQEETVVVDPTNASGSITLNDLDSMRNELKKAIPDVPKELYKKAIAMHLQFADANPKDAFAPVALDYAQGYYEQLQDFRSSVRYIDKILTDYPDYKNKPVLMFSKATHLDFLRDTTAAKEAYQDYLTTYKNTLSAEEKKDIEDLIKLVPYSMEERILMNSGKE